MAGLTKLVNTLILAGAVGLAGQSTPILGQEMAKAETGKEQTQTGTHDHSAKFYESTYSSKDIKNLESELKEHPTSQGYVRLSDLYFEIKQADDALSAARNAIKIDPNDWQGYHNTATYYLDKGNLEAAIKLFRQAIVLSPKALPPHSCLGVAYAKQRRYSDALSEIDVALSIDPNEPYSLNTKRSILQVLGKK